MINATKQAPRSAHCVGAAQCMIEAEMLTANHVAAGARVPDSEGEISGLESMINSSPRPFVIVGEREISVLRRGLTKDGWKRSLYLQPAENDAHIYHGAGLLSFANQSLEMTVHIPARGGHYHHFFCDCGSRLTFPEGFAAAAEYVCPACSKTYSGEDFDGAVRYMRHQLLARSALSLALVYSIEKDRAYADKAAEILTAYARAYPGPHTTATEGGIQYQSLCEAVWVIPLAQAYDLIYYSRSLTDDHRELIENSLFRPVAEGLKQVGIRGNWGSWHLSAAGVIGLAIKDVSLVRYALGSFRSQIADQLGDDGLWPESVHTFHFYALRAFVHFAEACYRAGIDIYEWEVRPGKSLKSMFTAPLGYMYPSFRLPAINDGWHDSFLPLDLYEIACRRWDDPMFAWVLKRAYKFGESPTNSDQREHPEAFRRNSFYAFLFGRDLPGRSHVPTIKSHDFQHIGICTLRNADDMVLTLHYGPFLQHGHLDKLSFTLYADGALLIPDYGTPGYGSKMLDYYTHTAAHNTVVVDGRPQERTTDRSLTARYSGSFMQFAEAVSEEHYPGVTQTRRIVVLGKACFVTDELSAGSAHSYDWLARFEGTPTLVGTYESADIDRAHYPQIDLEQAYRIDDTFRADFECENSNLAFAMWTHGEPGEVALGNCPAETASRRVPLFMCRQFGRLARFTAVLVSSPSSKVGLDLDGQGVSVSVGECTDYVFLRDGAPTGPGTLIDTDADLAAVRTVRGQVSAVALVRGTYVTWMNERLLECPVPVECVEVCLGDRTPSVRYCCDTAGVLKLRTSARAMRVNGHRTAASTSRGQALLRVTPQMLGANPIDLRS